METTKGTDDSLRALEIYGQVKNADHKKVYTYNCGSHIPFLQF